MAGSTQISNCTRFNLHPIRTDLYYDDERICFSAVRIYIYRYIFGGGYRSLAIAFNVLSRIDGGTTADDIT